jgi:hypothetical protein
VSAGAPPLPGLADVRLGATAGGAGAAADSVAPVVAPAVAYRSTRDALAALAAAEQQYESATAFLAARDTTAPPVDDSSFVYRARLAALDGVTAAARAALYEAPHDPVINRYYLATVSAREATLQQLNTALPDGRQITRF